MNKKNVLIFAGCSDKKLISKISPILDCNMVERLYLVRNIPLMYDHPKLKQYPPLSIFKNILVLREINRVLNGIYVVLFKKIDILMGIYFLMHGIYSYFLSRIFMKKHIFLFIENPQKYGENKLLFKMLSNTNYIGIRGNNSMQYLLKKGVPKEKFFIPPNEFEISDIKKEERKRIYDLIYIGNFVDVKDLPLWVEIVEEIKKDISNIKGVMLGDGPKYEDIKKMIIEKGLKENIELVGRKEDVFEYINQSKILLMTSKSEALPMVVVESMSVGVPVVVPNIGDISDIVINCKNGIVIDSREPKEYAKEIENLLEDSPLYEKLKIEAISSIKKLTQSCTHEKLVELWSNIFKNLGKDI